MRDHTNRILILFAHPALQESRVNQRLIAAVRELEGITFRDLYETYPDLRIHVRSEQSLLTSHDLVVFHHPFHWYSAPAILKEWQDRVLEHGWAYGQGGTALEGKKFLNVITAGGGEPSYQRGGHNRFTVRELLAPFEQAAHLCGMRFLPPFVVHGTHQLAEADLARHAEDYRRALIALRDDALDLEAADRYPRLNSNLAEIIKS